MNDLLSRLKAGRSAIASVKIGEVEFGLRVLTEQDYLSAGIAANTEMKLLGIELTVATADLFEDEKASQLLQRALVDPASGSPVASSARTLREALTRSERGYLVDAYLEHEKTFSPSERTMSALGFAELLEEVKKNPATTRLNDLSSDMLRKLIASLGAPPSI